MYIVVATLLGQFFLVYGVASIYLSLRKPTYTSSGAGSDRVVDGNRNGKWSGRSCWESDYGDMNPYWMVDLQGMFPVTHIAITNRKDCCAERLHDVEIVLYNENPAVDPSATPTHCSLYPGPVGAGVTQIIPCVEGNLTARFVKLNGLARINDNDRLTLCEVAVFNLVPCLKTKYIRVEKTRQTGTYETQHNLSKLDCLSACTRNFYCVGFNYGEGATCEIVTVPETATESPSWSFYKLSYP